jgi:hypothetical protein
MFKNRNNTNEEFLIGFSKDSAEPSIEFESKLQEKLVSSLNSSRKVKLIDLVMSNRNLIWGGLGVAFLLLLILPSVFFYPYVNKEYRKRTVDVNELLSNARTFSTGNSASGESAMMMDQGYMMYEEGYSIRIEEVERFDVGKCDGYTDDFEFTRSETYEYFSSEDSIYASKMIRTSTGNELIEFNLSADGYYYQYYGGDYAIRSEPYENYLDMDSSLISEKKEMSFSEYFGDDSKVKSITEIDGREYYIVESTWEYPCGTSGYDDFTKMISLAYITTDSNELMRNEVYFEEVDFDNLVEKIRYTHTNSKDTSYDEVKDIFVFDYAVEVRDFSYDVFDTSASQLETLKQTDTELLITKSKDTEILFFATSVMNEAFGFPYNDRSFYADTELGQNSYDMFNLNDPNQSGYEVSLTTDLFTTYTYASQSELDSLISQYDNVPNLERYEKELIVNGDKVSSKVIRIDQSVEVGGVVESIGSDESVDSPKVFDEFVSYEIYFEYKGHFYNIYYSGGDELKLEEFITLNSVKDYEEIKSRYVPFDEPSSVEPGSSEGAIPF